MFADEVLELLAGSTFARRSDMPGWPAWPSPEPPFADWSIPARWPVRLAVEWNKPYVG